MFGGSLEVDLLVSVVSDTLCHRIAKKMSSEKLATELVGIQAQKMVRAVNRHRSKEHRLPNYHTIMNRFYMQAFCSTCSSLK